MSFFLASLWPIQISTNTAEEMVYKFLFYCNLFLRFHLQGITKLYKDILLVSHFRNILLQDIFSKSSRIIAIFEAHVQGGYLLPYLYNKKLTWSKSIHFENTEVTKTFIRKVWMSQVGKSYLLSTVLLYIKYTEYSADRIILFSLIRSVYWMEFAKI